MQPLGHARIPTTTGSSFFRYLPCDTAKALTRKGRGTSVQVSASKKGKGKSMMRQQFGTPQQQSPQMVEPPTPEVDPENEEVVIFVRSRKPVSADGVMMMAPAWIPLTIVKGGSGLNVLVKAAQNPWGKKLFSRQLLKGVGLSIYKDIDSIAKRVRKDYGRVMANVPTADMEFGMKLRDKSVPKEWWKATDITLIPPAPLLERGALDDLKCFFAVANMRKLLVASTP